MEGWVNLGACLMRGPGIKPKTAT